MILSSQLHDLWPCANSIAPVQLYHFRHITSTMFIRSWTILILAYFLARYYTCLLIHVTDAHNERYRCRLLDKQRMPMKKSANLKRSRHQDQS